MLKDTSFKPTEIIIGFGLVLFIFFSQSCSSLSKKNEKKSNQIALPVYKVDTSTVTLTQNFLGTVEGKINVEIRPQVTGELEQAYVDEGDFVHKGQKLFKVNQQIYQQDLNRAKANVNLEEAKLSNAKLEIERIKPLVNNEVMSPVKLEMAKSNYEVALSNLKQAKAEVENAKIQMGYTIINAPVSGYIGRIPKRIGNVVSPGDKEPITALTDVHEVYVYFSISESNFYELLEKENSSALSMSDQAAHLDSEKVVSLILSDGTMYPEKGVIDASSGQVNKNTGSITLRATFPNKKNMLRSGNTGTIIMRQKHKGSILIPRGATFDLQANTYVEKLTPQNTVTRQKVEIGSSAPNNTYTVLSGLKIGDRILVEGQSNLSDSTKIKPLPYRPDTLRAPRAYQQIENSQKGDSM